METLSQKRFITLIVWLISIIISLILYIIVTDMGLIRANAPFDIYICAFPIIAALLWTGLGRRKNSSKQPSLSTTNLISTPTPYKMALLLEMMSEDEREALKHDLRQQVLGSDESLIMDMEKRKRE